MAAIDQSAVARVVGIETNFVNLQQGGVTLLPQRVAVVGQGSTGSVYSTVKRQVTSAAEAGSVYGFGSPVHLAVKQLLPQNGDGVGSVPVTVYPLVDDVSGVASTGSITPVADQTITGAYSVLAGNIESAQFVIEVGDTVAQIVTKMTDAINSNLDMPVTAVDNTTSVTLTSKWKGTSANQIKVAVQTPVTGGSTIGVTLMSGGLVNPSITAALAQVGNVWETMMLNCLDTGDTSSLDEYQTFGEGRWGALTRKPLIVFTGGFGFTVASLTAITDARRDDRINSQLVSPGSFDLPVVIAARQLARIVKVANNNPARDYGSQAATGLVPGADGDQWDYIERDQAVKKGSSTVEVRDGVVNISDVVTMFHPTGDPAPAYRYVVDVVKLQNILFNLDLIFANKDWDGAPLIPDDQPTVNPSAKKPKTAKAAINSMIDSLGLNAILSDPETAKANTVAVINSQNPKRLDVSLTVQLSGNANIISVDFNFGFFFGTPAIVA